MIKENKNRITKILERNNPWWKEGKVKIEFEPREIYPEIKKFMEQKQIIALTGLRRVGKTTIMFKIIKDFISKFGNKNIVYFSFDEFRDVRIESIIDSFLELTGKVNKGKYLVLFDEIQKVENWQEQLKRLYDENPNIKFVISGSESLFIRKNSRESLAGRIFEFQINPLTFKEYLEFKGKRFVNFKLYKKEILEEFNNYLLCSGFPEIINKEREVVEKYIKETVIEKIVYRDIPQIFDIREPAILEQVFRIILNAPGQIINLNDLASELGISRQTVSTYLKYLEKSFLIKKLYNFSKNVRKTQRKLKKYYPTILLPEIIEESFGKAFETTMVLELHAEYFWRDQYKNEVDVIKIENKEITPIEIKSGKIKERELKPLETFTDKFKSNKGKVISYDSKFKTKQFETIPFYEYFLD